MHKLSSILVNFDLKPLNLIKTIYDFSRQEVLLTETELFQLLQSFEDCPPRESLQSSSFQWRNLLFSQVSAGNTTYWYSQQIPIQINSNLSGIANHLAVESSTGKPDILYWRILDFLSPEKLQQLWNYLLTARSQFNPAHNSAGLNNYRQSLFTAPPPEIYSEISEKILGALIPIADELPNSSQEIGEIEMQITAHNDGHYYKIHNDNGSPDTATRFLTYVYYFYRQPKPFTGGELRLYELAIKDGFYVAGDRYQDIEPLHNSLIVFPSHYMHEVLPIRCPSQRFEDSRFTVNGWIRVAID
ncbi:2OG-FeII oxygenase superfamily protein [Synechococcus elongatus PCC 6311]|uniref:Prolyl 4-hydroxylase, alpha subunit n=2 Tax=Synechococcus elongatus TaxID=32046 RepID=Q8GIS6_SYNE7|nr:unknown [Synechococcus elongatus PCC 7942 = FACHB-805]AJD57032.1 proline hydroxylase [Synechococcus elongatus UTEX 2973]MBD2587231.1 2OG-Fe(II) oxygenase [Synechococcus elongatus FACHB-242]MBD2688301.1 2OG-Fe(II) oxygenase [Synechococcus elongatus FACHB-1061]UOW72307.1 2OG-FeII oxygenase superfamily protein [Synechococcus elongatus PCC 7943]UOW75028.1 2OG-FeII oxygenase superfamily protein [Synechococcus elongatus PCC 6311]UOW77748.1 2OG-FeII oxygenase superfamily protein [Synechococcus el